MSEKISNLTPKQYFSAIKTVDNFWWNVEKINEYLIREGEPKNEQEGNKYLELSKEISSMKEHYSVGVVQKEDYSYWLEMFEQLRKIKEPLETEKICCWWREDIYDFLESKDSRFMNEKNQFSIGHCVMTPLIKIKLAEMLVEHHLCNYCKLLIKILDESVSKWNKDKRFYLPYDKRFE